MLTPLARTKWSTAGEVDAAARKLGIERAQCYRLLRRLRGPNCHGAAPRSKRTLRRCTLAQQGCGSHRRVLPSPQLPNAG
ncbi:MAG: hypothetical protein KIC89_21905 [Acetobacteraceae bacterium]|nr:hypothetical protein [Acetobacteraceae bacterium]